MRFQIMKAFRLKFGSSVLNALRFELSNHFYEHRSWNWTCSDKQNTNYIISQRKNNWMNE